MVLEPPRWPCGGRTWPVVWALLDDAVCKPAAVAKGADAGLEVPAEARLELCRVTRLCNVVDGALGLAVVCRQCRERAEFCRSVGKQAHAAVAARLALLVAAAEFGLVELLLVQRLERLPLSLSLPLLMVLLPVWVCVARSAGRAAVGVACGAVVVGRPERAVSAVGRLCGIGRWRWLVVPVRRVLLA